MIRTYFQILLILLSAQLYAQEGTNTAGGDATGLGGSVSFTVGQLDYLVSEDSLIGGDSLRMAGPPVGNASQGIQQAEDKTQATVANDYASVEISAGPNPAVDFIDVTIKNYSGETVLYVLSDAGGKVVLNGSSSSLQFRIDIGEVASGNYLLRFSNNNTEISNKSIVISK